MKKSTLIAIIVGLGLIIPASLWYGQHNGLLPLAAATEADLYDDLFNSLLTIAVAIFLIVQAILIYSIVKFRRREGDDSDGMPIHDNFLLEIIWTAVPTVLVIWVGIYSFDVYSVMQNGRPMSMGMGMPAMSHNHLGMEAANADTLSPQTSSKLDSKAANAEPSNTEPLNIDVQGMQFAWIFSYPNTEIQTSELHVPLGREIKLNLSAIDVIHAFWVPQFRLKQDTIPGMATTIQFTPNVLGTYPIVCAELCGSYHGGMRAEIFVETPEEYQAWLAQEQEDLASAKTNGALASNSPFSGISKKISDKIHSEMGHKQILAAQSQKMGIDAEMIKTLHHTAPHI